MKKTFERLIGPSRSITFHVAENKKSERRRYEPYESRDDLDHDTFKRFVMCAAQRGVFYILGRWTTSRPGWFTAAMNPACCAAGAADFRSAIYKGMDAACLRRLRLGSGFNRLRTRVRFMADTASAATAASSSDSDTAPCSLGV